jgi:hypothetical protein
MTMTKTPTPTLPPFINPLPIVVTTPDPSNPGLYLDVATGIEIVTDAPFGVRVSVEYQQPLNIPPGNDVLGEHTFTISLPDSTGTIYQVVINASIMLLGSPIRIEFYDAAGNIVLPATGARSPIDTTNPNYVLNPTGGGGGTPGSGGITNLTWP